MCNTVFDAIEARKWAQMVTQCAQMRTLSTGLAPGSILQRMARPRPDGSFIMITKVSTCVLKPFFQRVARNSAGALEQCFPAQLHNSRS